jgi:hypothetical protein
VATTPPYARQTSQRSERRRDGATQLIVAEAQVSALAMRSINNRNHHAQCCHRTTSPIEEMLTSNKSAIRDTTGWYH